MINNESTSKDRGEYGGEPTLVSRVVTTERAPVRSTRAAMTRASSPVEMATIARVRTVTNTVVTTTLVSRAVTTERAPARSTRVAMTRASSPVELGPGAAVRTHVPAAARTAVLSRAGDRVSSWFGNDKAERHRCRDAT